MHHIGLTVESVDDALRFWSAFLRCEPVWRRVLSAPYLGRITGYPGVRIDAALIELPDQVLIELLEYQIDAGAGQAAPPATPGSVHVCLRTRNVARSWQAALACGASRISDMPVDIDEGPNAGATAVYVKIHDGITLELYEPPRRGSQ